jgi:UDP-GlcNAc:undecaprenyl-phosphate/decaprenyl-phosphate GlcNAc-1-phosphate transferase
MDLCLPFAVALGTALLSMPIIRAAARRAGFVDQPTRRKVHVTPVPLGGGLGLLLGFLLGGAAWFVARPAAFEARAIGGWLAGLLIIAAVGIRDDRSPLGPLPKLAGQFAAALALVLGTGIPDPHALSGLAVPAAVLGTVALMNACNFLDNMDGILGGIAVVCALGFAAVAPPSSPVVAIAAALAGGAAGFLAFNFAPARIFMGDAGSLAIGYLLAALAIELAPRAIGSGAELTLLIGLGLIVGYPLFDLTFVTVTRLADGRRPWTPGKDHSTHRLNRVLHDPRRTALAVYGLTAVIAAIGIAVARSPAAESLVLAVGGVLALLVLGLGLARVPAA